MRNRFVQLAAAVALLGSAAVAGASNSDAKHATGFVTRVDLAKGKLEMVNGNITQRYRIDASTPCSEQGKSVELARLAPGTQLLVDWSREHDQNVVTRIEVLPAAAAGDAKGSH
jgi:hypothetical protein